MVWRLYWVILTFTGSGAGAKRQPGECAPRNEPGQRPALLLAARATQVGFGLIRHAWEFFYFLWGRLGFFGVKNSKVDV